jgi:uncharacterized protein (TIGR04141 family)
LFCRHGTLDKKELVCLKYSFEGESMKNTYNIYRMPKKNDVALNRKIKEVGLIEQKTINYESYELTFYFSENLQGNPIWWYSTYKDFFLPQTIEPKNMFFYGLLVIENKKKKDFKYLVSLGKSHFYLQKIIEPDFGINVAIHIAKEDTLLMKKSRFFSGSKRQEIASYIKFEPNNYKPGESVDHLKLKAKDEALWGEQNIVFADSIQLDLELEPEQLVSVIKDIESALEGQKIIDLPKMDKEKDEEKIRILDTLLVDKIMNRKSTVIINDFTVFGIEICFTFLNYEYELYYWNEGTLEKTNFQRIGTDLQIDTISNYLHTLPTDFNIDNIRIRFYIGDKGKFTQNLKDILDIQINLFGTPYALKNGDWYFFNQTFLAFLEKSLTEIPITIKEDFLETDYLAWKSNKQTAIATNDSDNKLLYPEFYFNTLQAEKNGYELMDRELSAITSLKKAGRKYQIEIADLYANKTIFAVKIDSSDKAQLIYNIEQSTDAILLVTNGTITTDKEIETACLWFVLGKRITSVTDINSIQFLLAIETWKQVMVDHNIKPLIYFSYYRK